MIREEGIVVSSAGESATVAILRKSACESCAAAGICHPQDEKRSFMEAANPLKAIPGQKVLIELRPQIYMQMPIVLYGIPLASLVSGAIIAKKLSLHAAAGSASDWWAFFAGITCMVISYASIRAYAHKIRKTPKFKPVIREILP